MEKATGIAKSSLQRYASGITTKIPLTAIEKLAETFEVSPAYIMGWDEAEEKPAEQDELSENIQALIAFAKTVPENKAAKVLKAMKLILEDD